MVQIDLDQMEQLVRMMIDNDLSELHFKHGDLEIDLKRGGAVSYAAPAHPPHPVFSGSPQVQAFTPPPSPAPPEDEFAGLAPIRSPMVGTFYAAPDPDTPPFVSPGTRITKDTTVCIIEAMKVFNEIKAEVDGIIERVMVENAQPVEYGQPLFYVRTTK